MMSADDLATARFHANVKAISDSIDQRDRTIRELSDALEAICDELAIRPSDDGPLVTAGRAALAKARGEVA